MMKEKEQVKVQFPDSTRIKCKDCVFRDKTEIELNGKTFKVGVTKDFCDIYQKPPKSNGKPIEVLFNNEDCEFYVKEERERNEDR